MVMGLYSPYNNRAADKGSNLCASGLSHQYECHSPRKYKRSFSELGVSLCPTAVSPLLEVAGVGLPFAWLWAGVV